MSCLFIMRHLASTRSSTATTSSSCRFPAGGRSFRDKIALYSSRSVLAASIRATLRIGVVARRVTAQTVRTTANMVGASYTPTPKRTLRIGGSAPAQRIRPSIKPSAEAATPVLPWVCASIRLRPDAPIIDRSSVRGSRDRSGEIGLERRGRVARQRGVTGLVDVDAVGLRELRAAPLCTVGHDGLKIEQEDRLVAGQFP